MLVYKFGGASVQDAKGVRNVVDIISKTTEKLIVVVSAMGKMTNAFEHMIERYYKGACHFNELKAILEYHYQIIEELNLPSNILEPYVKALDEKLESFPSIDYNFEYDQIIGYGELFSTVIVAAAINQKEKIAEWKDVRELIITDNNYRFAKVDWENTIENVQSSFQEDKVYLTQGFIASSSDGNTTSLGREGSDYSAAILSYALDAKALTIWKDVPGVLNSDPRLFNNTELLEQISYYDAIELAFFGAQVIHPKTIQPLQNKSIPLKVKSFFNPEQDGTLVSKEDVKINIPVVIIKENQVLLSIKTKDLSFVDEQNISSIFGILSSHNAKVNMMLNGAVSFSIVIDFMPRSFETLLEELLKEFEVRYNSKLRLITIRHYSKNKIAELIGNKKVFLEQKSRNTAQYLISDSE